MRFALFAVLAVALPVAAQAPTADEQKAIEAIEKLGGKGDTDEKLPAEARVTAKFEAATDATFAALKKHPTIGHVNVFDATKCTEKSFAALKELPNLRVLVVGRATLSPNGVAAIGGCKELRHLALVGSGVSDAEVAGLKDLTLLEHLSLSENPQVTDKSMATIKGFERLHKLYLSKTGITDKGLAELRPLDGLRTLEVRETKVTLDYAEKFPDGMPNLRMVAR